MFQLDIQGKCQTCLAKANNSEMIRCDTCQFYFHAICDSVDGNSDGIAKKTHLNLHKQASTKKNFLWKCDRCLTISEHNEAASVKEMVKDLIDRFANLENQLQTQVSQLELQVSTHIKSQVSEEFKKLTASQSEEFQKLNDSVSNKVPDPVESVPSVWNNNQKLEEIKSALLIKSKDGVPVNSDSVKQIMRENGIPVKKMVVTSTGDTFINLPNKQSRDKLKPLIPATNDVVELKSKLPTVNLHDVTEDLSKDQIRQSLCSQNEVIGNLVNAGEELTVIYTRQPPHGKDFYKVTVRVSPKIRNAMKTMGDRVYLSSGTCKIKDSFHIRRCNKCQSYGHYADKCNPTTPVACGYCGENHKSSDCGIKARPEEYKCCNCAVAGIASVDHSTFNLECPAYKIEQDKLKSSISYDYSSLN